MADVKKLAEELVSLTVKQVQELADVLKADYGSCSRWWWC
jgi:large subunit ribosomal protein L7/L12